MLAEQRRKGGEMLVAQMEDQRRNAGLERQRREREIAEMTAASEMAREEDVRIARERRTRAHEFMQDCLAANRLAMRRKQREKDREADEEQMMVEYQREKGAREEERERQVREQKAQKEREISEMRKRQQRTIDMQAEKDALMARRAAEEKERAARKKELDDVRRQREVKEQQERDRQEALRLRQRRVAEIAKLEKAEFDRITAAAASDRERERQAELRKEQANAEYRQALKDEMERKRVEKQLEPLVHLDEQKHLEDQNSDYLAKLEGIRQMKIEMLRQEGVPEKFLTNLKRMRFVLK
jgi:hypothetical protein